MLVLDGAEAGLVEACKMIAAAPHPDHLREYRIVTGTDGAIDDMLVDSVRHAEVVAYAAHGPHALVGGISADGLIKREIWFLTTSNVRTVAKWLLREARRMLRLADSHFGPLSVFGQVIPVDYPEGINFARHLGFHQMDNRVGPDGDALAVMERCGLWAQMR